ncbi:LacI family DNA-binding transcriptional regulator [Anaerorhabdus furcosa]|uniref:Transcriptional regulator, LacI family n=1 Tax=Anaerorhabdus furcosa TaxID=118967 RepID=A0A1T4P738_9FIRM|nr:LacI family DNA-binding transcriptional regulator [Anaerorhabdus furcosa]SJZ87026.1 transcriptional regulator, LacI family [Anaerorhabdus furcosa]
MKRVTIYDVAKDAGVSLATVSRVINGSDVVKGPTRDKVEAAIEKLGYKPNAIAQGLALQKTTTIGLVIPEASFTYTGQIINGVIAVAGMYNYNIMLHTTTEGVTDISDIIETIIKSHVDGVVIYNDKILVDEMDTLSKYNIPIVIIGNKMSGHNICSVYVDIEKAVYELSMKYLSNGKKDIAIIQDRKNEYAISQMIKGVTRAYKEKGMEFNNYLEIPESYRTSYNYLKDYLKDHKHDLIIANRDSQAMAVCNAAKENGIEIPKEMEVVCVIDTKYNSMVRPQISSFAIPSYDLGMVSMRVMTKMLQSDEIDEDEIELSYLFTPRQSTK